MVSQLFPITLCTQSTNFDEREREKVRSYSYY